MTDDKDLIIGICTVINNSVSGMTCRADILLPNEPGVMVQMALSPQRLTRWLDGGAGKYSATFTLIGQSSQQEASSQLTWLNSAKQAFYQLDRLLTGERVVAVDATVPSKVGVLPSGLVRYATTINLTYYE